MTESKMSPRLAASPNSIPQRPSNMAVIQACTLLNGIDEADRDKLTAVSAMAYAERGETIWIAGSASTYSGVVGIGFIKMTKCASNGMEIAVELLGPVQCFGLLVAVEGRPFPLSAIAVTNTWYLKIPTRELQEIYRNSSILKDQIVRSLGPRLRRAHDMMSRLSSGRVEERIAAVLLILIGSYGKETSSGTEIEVPLTRHDISEMAGTTTETTIRVMSKWQKESVISTDRSVITVLDKDALEEVLQNHV
ncbi:Crp/Fnr family transcriptional regulator [soil metagenome]